MLVVTVMTHATNEMSYGALVCEKVLENMLVAYRRMSCDQCEKSVKRSTSMLNELTIWRQNTTRIWFTLWLIILQNQRLPQFSFSSSMLYRCMQWMYYNYCYCFQLTF